MGAASFPLLLAGDCEWWSKRGSGHPEVAKLLSRSSEHDSPGSCSCLTSRGKSEALAATLLACRYGASRDRVAGNVMTAAAALSAQQAAVSHWQPIP